MVELWAPFCAIETAFVHRDTYPARKAEYGPTLAGFIDAGRSADPLTIARSNIERDRFKGKLVRLFQKVDLVLMPAIGLGAPEVRRDEARAIRKCWPSC